MATPLKPIARRALAAQSDQRLVLLLREGHDPAFDEIVRRYRPSLVAFAGAIAGASRAEDVVQGGLIRAHEALTGDDREIRLRPWLFAIVRNGALNAVRDDPAWSELAPELHGDRPPTATAEQREELERLVDAICALPESQRQALVMREMEGVGHDEIAAKLETSPTAVRGLIFRARTTLRNALGALVPLPVLRWLLEDTAVATAAGAAGAGGGGLLAGSVLGKAAVGLTAAVVAVGAGKALNDDRTGGDRPAVTPTAAGPGNGGARRGIRASGGGNQGTGAPVEARGERIEERRELAEERREATEEAREERADRHEERRETRGDRREDEGDDDGEGSDDDDGEPDDDSSGSSGSSGGDRDDDELEPEPDDDRFESESEGSGGSEDSEEREESD